MRSSGGSGSSPPTLAQLQDAHSIDAASSRLWAAAAGADVVRAAPRPAEVLARARAAVLGAVVADAAASACAAGGGGGGRATPGHAASASPPRSRPPLTRLLLPLVSLHWVYDLDVLRAAVKNEEPAFLDPPVAAVYQASGGGKRGKGACGAEACARLDVVRGV